MVVLFSFIVSSSRPDVLGCSACALAYICTCVGVDGICF